MSVTVDKPRAKRRKSPKPSGLTVRAYRIRVESMDSESRRLFKHCTLLAEARNILVSEREANCTVIKAQKLASLPVDKYLTRADQYKRRALLVKEDRRFAVIHSQVLQNVAERIDVGTQAWLTHLKEKRAGKKSPPGQVEASEYPSFTYPQFGISAHIRAGKLHLSKLGEFRLREYRKLKGNPKSITIKFEQGHWWASISCEVREQDVYRSPTEIAHLPDLGADPGLETLLALSDGRVFDPPNHLKLALNKLRHEQKSMARKFEMRKKLHKEENLRRKMAKQALLPPMKEIPYSHRLNANIKRVAKLHTKVEISRLHQHFKIASILDNTVRCLGMEEHGVLFMLRNSHQAQAATDRALAQCKTIVANKLGKQRYVPVGISRPGIGGNSQTCLCGASVPKTLSDRIHHCPECGLTAPRDVVSANIVQMIAFGTSVLQVPKKEAIVVPKEFAQQAKAEAGHADAGIKPKRRGVAEGRHAIARARVKAKALASEVSKKRQPESNQEGETASGKPTAGAKTGIVSKNGEHPVKSLHREANTPLPQSIVAQEVTNAILAEGSTVSLGR